MKTSCAGLDLIKEHEGLSLTSYRCPAGVWTVGYGSTKGVRPWTILTKARAEERLREDIEVAERAVEQVYYLQRGLKQCQYDALVSFVFNIGIKAFANSTLRKKVITNPDDPSIENEFKKWIYASGKPLAGLIFRRADEAELYFNRK